MQVRENARLPVGTLELQIYRDGALIERWAEENLIVDGASSILAALLGGNTSGKTIAKIGLGTSNAQPVKANDNLTNKFVKAISSVQYPAAGQVRFNFSIGTGDANGLDIAEFGLFSGDDTMFSRRVRSTPIPKDNTISFTGSWTITF